MVHHRHHPSEPDPSPTNRFFGGSVEADEVLIEQANDRARALLAGLREYSPKRLGVRVENGVPYSEICEAMRLVLYARWSPVPMTLGTMAGVSTPAALSAGCAASRSYIRVARPSGCCSASAITRKSLGRTSSTTFSSAVTGW